KRWVVNGVEFAAPLAEIIALSKKLLHPASMAMQPTAFSHGDDHNGNKFLIDGEFITFDPAFAGRHPALLAIMKGAMHNGPLHPFWYYEPERVIGRLKIDFNIGARIEITHNGAEILASNLREQIFALHARHAWHPLLNELSKRGWLWEGWQDFVRAAAFCCPFLALNMIDPARRAGPGGPLLPGTLPLFNLAQCVRLFHTASEILIPENL
ncbi:MAG TPA: hypothetical protein VHB73_01680, partial [Alphaproteobacteria bacterium]|nr:hypothetical protein [Alphaproteobacteria bacterium]